MKNISSSIFALFHNNQVTHPSVVISRLKLIKNYSISLSRAFQTSFMLQTTHIDDIIKSAADIAFVEVLYILIYLLRERDVIE